MTRQLDIEQLLDTWLDEGPTDAADDVFDAAVARVYRQRQRPAWRFLPREPTVNTPIKVLLAAAAIIVVAVVGGGFLLNKEPPVSSIPSPSPSPSPPTSPSPSPSVTAVFPSWFPQPSGGSGAGLLAAGSQSTRHHLPGFTFDIPVGWVNDADFVPVYSLFPDTPANEAEHARSGDTAQNIVISGTVENNMLALCDQAGLFRGATAAAVIDFIVANEAYSTTEPVDVTIGGLSGQQVDIRLSPDWTGACRSETDPTRDYLDARSRVIMLDTPAGRPVGIEIASLHSADWDAFLAGATPIIQSIEFDFGSGPSASP